MSTMRWAGFGLVWLALVIFTWDGMARRRRALRLEPRRRRSVTVQPLLATEGNLSLSTFI